MSDVQFKEWTNQLKIILHEFEKQITPLNHQIIVIGCSTSEIAGESIGTAGSSFIAEMVFTQLKEFSKRTRTSLAFQCCEHLNRALVIEQETLQYIQAEEVSVIPVPKAGGSLAAYAYQNLKNPAVVEFIKADYGIDIGDTFIGMHLKHVAVPVRVSISEIGHAHVTLAKTRPKLIGGQRAVYTLN